MKRSFSIFICILLILSFFVPKASAEDNIIEPYVTYINVTSEVDEKPIDANNTRATGLIQGYSLYLSKTGNTLNIRGQTYGSTEVVKCGFKGLTIQRRKSSSDSWEDYYEYGNVYADATGANLSTTLVVESGYQYRISCKHYAKKNILSVQTISNTSNIVTVS